MTWTDELIEKKFVVHLNAELYTGDILKIEGKEAILVDDLTSAVLEERNRIEEVVLKESVCARGSIRHHEHARSFKSLLEKSEELKKK